MGKIKRIENGNVKTQEGDVWPPQEEILDFIIVVAGAYSRYGIPSQSHFKTQVEISVDMITSVLPFGFHIK